jgi:hypothetical protein
MLGYEALLVIGFRHFEGGRKQCCTILFIPRADLVLAMGFCRASTLAIEVVTSTFVRANCSHFVTAINTHRRGVNH